MPDALSLRYQRAAVYQAQGPPAQRLCRAGRLSLRRGAQLADGEVGPILDRRISLGHVRPTSDAYSPISSFHSVGWSAIKPCIMCRHSLLCSTSSCTPRSRSSASSPTKLWFSPMITLGMPYSRIAPLHMAQGERVV